MKRTIGMLALITCSLGASQGWSEGQQVPFNFPPEPGAKLLGQTATYDVALDPDAVLVLDRFL